MRCGSSSCGTTLKDGAAFCHICGKKVLDDTCPKCGTKVTSGAKFCHACGTSLEVTKVVEDNKLTTSAPATDTPN